jgi:hypothetical protein
MFFILFFSESSVFIVNSAISSKITADEEGCWGYPEGGLDLGL